MKEREIRSNSTLRLRDFRPPFDSRRRNSQPDFVVRDRFGDNRTGAHNCTTTDLYTLENDDIDTEPNIISKVDVRLAIATSYMLSDRGYQMMMIDNFTDMSRTLNRSDKA
jgi:hypothetical protein